MGVSFEYSTEVAVFSASDDGTTRFQGKSRETMFNRNSYSLEHVFLYVDIKDLASDATILCQGI